MAAGDDRKAVDSGNDIYIAGNRKHVPEEAEGEEKKDGSGGSGVPVRDCLFFRPCGLARIPDDSSPGGLFFRDLHGLAELLFQIEFQREKSLQIFSDCDTLSTATMIKK